MSQHAPEVFVDAPRERTSAGAVPTSAPTGSPANYVAVLTYLQQNCGNAATRLVVQRISHGTFVQRQRRPQTDPLDAVVADAARRLPELAGQLRGATLRMVVRTDRAVVTVTGQAPVDFPVHVVTAQAGTYLFRWDARGNPVPASVVDLAHGTCPLDLPVVDQVAGVAELARIRSLRIGVVHVPQTIVATPAPRGTGPAERLVINLRDHEITAAQFRAATEVLGARPLILGGIAGGVLEPDHTYGPPLNFVYRTQNGARALVTRRLLGRDFYYSVPIDVLRGHLQLYPLQYAGIAAAPMVVAARVELEIGPTLLPFVGPLIGLAETLADLRRWHGMRAWEKVTVGAGLLLSLLPAGRAVYRGATGAYRLRRTVAALTRAGLPAREARQLAFMGSVLQQEEASRRTVQTLNDFLLRSRARRLGGDQIADLRRTFAMMIERLPAAEAAFLRAGIAGISEAAAREYLGISSLTARQFAGFQRLEEDARQALQTAMRDEGVVVGRVLGWAGESPAAASAVNSLAANLRRTHLAGVADRIGGPLLREFGESGIAIEFELSNFVRRNARGADSAYDLLMRGRQGGRAANRFPGLGGLLTARRPPLPPALQPVAQQFAGYVLTVDQLRTLASLAPGTRASLQGVADHVVRRLAHEISALPDAAIALNTITAQLAPAVTGASLGSLLERCNGSLLAAVGGTSLAPDLISAITRSSSPARARQYLMEGITAAGTALPGLVDLAARRVPYSEGGQRALAAMGSEVGGQVFARWALANPAALRAAFPTLGRGVNALAATRPTDAGAQLARLFAGLDANPVWVTDFLEAAAEMHARHGPDINLGRLIAGLGARGRTAQGARYVMNYAARGGLQRIEEFEHVFEGGGVRRDYDIAADGLYFELKDWQEFGGPGLSAAADEFERDVILHAADGFARLRWVVGGDAGSRSAVETMMLGVLSRRSLRERLPAGLSVDLVRGRLQAALRGPLLSFWGQ